MTEALRKATEHLRPNLIPVLQYPDGTYRGETTTLAYDLESRHKERSVIPAIFSRHARWRKPGYGRRLRPACSCRLYYPRSRMRRPDDCS
jgi:hypothetical protein